MYKIKFIHYKIYEYQLLQDMLNQMANQGYHTNQLSLITLFKQTGENAHYRVDLFSTKEESHYNQNRDRDRFIDSYQNYDYHEIYHYQRLYVFKGQQELPPIDWSKKNDAITQKQLSQTFLFGCLCAILSAFFLYNSIQGFDIQTFLTYGSFLIYLALSCFLVLMSIQFFYDYFQMSQLKNKLGKEKNLIRAKKRHHFFHRVFFILLLIFIGGFIEDSFNTQTLSLQDHPQITLQDLYNQKSTSYTYTQKRGFFIPKYYRYLETTDDTYTLLIEQYICHNEENAQTYLLDMIQHPTSSYDQITPYSDNVYIGNLDNKNISVFIRSQSTISVISLSDNISNQNIEHIIQYYQS